MTIQETQFEGLLVIQPQLFADERGYFYESYNKKVFRRNGILNNFRQDNQALSQYGVLRGLHFQKEPYAQSKLVRAVLGKILDVAVDIRQGSPTFGQAFSIELSSENHLQVLIPKGFAHGYSVLSETALIQYKCDAYYSNKHEGGVRWDDPTLGIDWKIPQDKMIVSEKDRVLPLLKDCHSGFIFPKKK